MNTDLSRVLLHVRDFLGERELSCVHIVCALSGGGDSVGLLLALNALKEEFQLSLSALHVHHGLRGEEADRDAAFCQNLCEDLGIECRVVHVDVRSRAKACGESIETAARNLRYAVYEEELSHYGEKAYLATAHTATDNVETVLFRMARGTGLSGLCGIPKVRGRYLRPLLSLSGEEVRQYVRGHGYSFVEDSTNCETTYTRNYIRHEILPRLDNVHAGAISNISCMIEGLVSDEEYLHSKAVELISCHCKDALRPAIAAAPLPIAMRAIRVLYDQVRTSKDALTMELTKTAYALICQKRSYREMGLPGGVVMVLDGDALFFQVGESDCGMDPTPLQPGENLLCNGMKLFLLKNASDTDMFFGIKSNRKLTQIRLDPDTIKGELYVRSRMDGDAYRYGGMTHKVKRMLSDLKMPVTERRRYPMVCDGQGIIWVPGFPPRDGSEGKKDSQALLLCFTMEENCDRGSI